VLVELLNSGLEVGSGLVLDETLATGTGSVTLTVDLTVDDVQTRLAGEVFQILKIKLASEGGARIFREQCRLGSLEGQATMTSVRTCQLVSNGSPVIVIR
jgi:hypothetical protein